MSTIDGGMVVPGAQGARISLKKLGAGVAGLALLAAAASYGWNWWTVGRFMETTDDAYVGGDITVISSKVPGLVAEVAVADNQRVKAGDLLVKLDGRDYQAQLDRANAAVAAQLAALDNLEATRRLQQAMIDQSAADLGATQAETIRTKYDLDRYKALTSEQFASAQRYQQADADHKKAQSAHVKAQAALTAAQRRIEVIDSQRQQVQAALQQAKAERDLAQLNLSYTEIRAPVDGVVGNRGVRPGAYAPVGAQLLSVVPAQGLWIDANFKESQIGHMRPGQSVSIKADVLPGLKLQGKVESLAPATGSKFSVIPAENATGNFTRIVQRVPIRVALEGAAGELGFLRPGLSVTVSVDEREPRK